MKIKRTPKAKNPTRRAKARILSPKKRTTSVTKKKKPAALAKKKVAAKNPVDAGRPAHTAPAPSETGFQTDISPFAGLNDEYALANAWEILGDEEYLLDDEVWNTLYNRIKLQLLRTTYSFRVEDDGGALSPYAVTAMPAFRAEHEPGYLSAGSFTILRPELPGTVFDLKISTSDQALLLDWQLTRANADPSSGHVALYLDGELVEAANLMQNRCHLELTRDDMGDAAFYFLDAATGKQTKILELSL